MFKIGGWLVGLFFLLMLVVPASLQLERGFFLIFILIGSIIVLLKSHTSWSISTPILHWLFFCTAYSVFSILLGVINDAQDAISLSTVYVFWPFLFVYFIGFVKTIERYIVLIKILIIGVFIGSISGILFIASSFYSEIKILDPYFNLMDGRLGLYEDSIRFNLKNLATLIYGFPLLMSILILSVRSPLKMSVKWKAFCFLTLLLSLLVMLISGRRAFIVVGLASIPLSLVIMRIVGVARFHFGFIFKIFGTISILFCLALFVASINLDLKLSSLVDDFLSGFNFSDASTASTSRRVEQFNALMEEWQNSPIIGFGHGSGAKSAPGDGAEWEYELQYIALLFQTGILGILIYSSAVFWLMWQMVILSRKYIDLATLLIPTLVGLSCFLIANATNPYLSKFDYLWTLFLSVGLVNIGKLREKNLNYKVII